VLLSLGKVLGVGFVHLIGQDLVALVRMDTQTDGCVMIVVVVILVVKWPVDTGIRETPSLSQAMIGFWDTCQIQKPFEDCLIRNMDIIIKTTLKLY